MKIEIYYHLPPQGSESAGVRGVLSWARPVSPLPFLLRRDCDHQERRLTAILVSLEEFESLKETAAVQSDVTLMKDIQKGFRALKMKKAKLYTLEELFR